MPIKKKWLSIEEFEKILGGGWTPSPHTHLKADIIDTPWAWGDVLKTGSNLTDLATRQHAGLTDILADQHHAQSHTLASHSTKAHAELTNVTSGQHHAQAHVLVGGDHTAAGLTIGHVLKATGASAFAFQANNLGGLSDVNIQTPLEFQGLFYIDGEWVNRPEITFDMPYTSFKMYTDFFDKNENPPWTEVVLSSGTITDIAGTAVHPGIVRIGGSSLTQSGYRYRTGQTTGIGPILITGKEMAEIVFRTGASVASRRFIFGYHNGLTPGEPNNGVFLHNASGTLTGRCVAGGTLSTTGTSYTLLADNWYRGRLEVNGDATRVDFWLYSQSGTELWTNNLTTNIPTSAGQGTAHNLMAWQIGTTPITDILYVDMMAGYCSRPIARG